MKKPYVKERNLRRAEAMQQAQLTQYSVDEGTGCWTWEGCLGRDGYGKVKRHGKTLRAHRVYYEHYVGPIPEGLVVMHVCDNPRCVNPSHLRCGTHEDNERDKDLKQRRSPSPTLSHPDSLPRGESHHRYGKGMPDHVKSALLEANLGRSLSVSHREKLSPLTCREISQIKTESGTQKEIAEKYGVSKSTIGRILREERWGHITGANEGCEETSTLKD